MSQRNSDYNLLFGILAVQMDFVGREQLIAAMNAWVLDKASPIAHILEGLGYLSAERRVLLEALVNEHLKQHQDDAKQSLAAIGSVDVLHEELGQLSDQDVQASLAHISAARTIDPYATVVPASDAAVPGVRFKILRPHARGGLGLVSVALDHELSREVAFKEIQSRHAHNPDSRRRFVLEAEITGGLEHPGIVPVYSFGSYPDGRPFYAMRFIKGDTLKTAIEAYHSGKSQSQTGQIELRNLLHRFVDVCDAIAYAHSRGVLHRDLKPSNIMLGKYGETLVVDWGLAKPLGHRDETHRIDETTLEPPSASSGSGETLPGSALGTPAYMSPEQAAGRLDDIGPTADVYSLGATLYHLLVGTSPFDGMPIEEVLRRVQSADYRHPRDVTEGIPPPLEAICLKAMSLRPVDRYPGSRELAEDIEHWLADEPVAAYQESRLERLGRWTRRHRNFIPYSVTVIILVVTFLLGRIVYLEQQSRDQRRDEELETTALYLADSVSDKIRTFADFLENVENDSPVRMLLVRANELPDDEVNVANIQSWIEGRYRVGRPIFQPDSLFINSADGTQMGRSPAADSVGKNFRHRDYFHGRGHDLWPDKAMGITAIQRPHVSIATSSVTSRFLITISVPIWSGDSGEAGRQVLGVMGTTVDCYDFAELDTPSSLSKTVNLITLNADFLEGEAKRGLILKKQPFAGEAHVRIDEALVDRLHELRAKRATQLSSSNVPSQRSEYSDPDEVLLDYRFRDPLQGSSKSPECVAAFAPVFVKGDQAEANYIDTGLVVVVREK